jgi:hypothetical protein
MDFSRDLFLSEFIINYLQSTYPNIYSDVEIIRKYIEYKKLKDLEYRDELPSEEKEKLEELNIYFYGNSDGSSSGDTGYNLINLYRTTIDIIENLINKNDNAVRDVVTGLVDLVQVDMKYDTDNSAFKKYLNELIIPSLFKENTPTESAPSGELVEPTYTFTKSDNKPSPIRKILSKQEINEKKEAEKVEQKNRNAEILEAAKIKAQELKEKRDKKEKEDEEEEDEEDEEEDNEGKKKKEKKKKEKTRKETVQKEAEEEEEDDEEEEEEKEEAKKKKKVTKREGDVTEEKEDVTEEEVVTEEEDNTKASRYDKNDFYVIKTNDPQTQFGVNGDGLSGEDSDGFDGSRRREGFDGRRPDVSDGRVVDETVSETVSDGRGVSETVSKTVSDGRGVGETVSDGRVVDESLVYPRKITVPDHVVGDSSAAPITITVTDSKDDMKGERTYIIPSNNLFNTETIDGKEITSKFDVFATPPKEKITGGIGNNLKDFDIIYDKISDLELIKKINNKQLIFLLLNTNTFSSLITKNKSANVLKRYAESILLTIFKTIKQNIIFFIKSDILLSSHFNIKEIIYYNFINFLYLYYEKIYDDNKNKEVIIELLNDNYRYSKKRDDDDNYLLRFIYQYSKNQDISKLLGYDSFKTYMFLNSYGKLYDTLKLNKKSYDISKCKSSNFYNFIDLKREFTIHLTDVQLKECVKDLSKISKSGIDKTKHTYIINDKILDKICIYSDNIFKEKRLPIINFNSYLEKSSNKSLKDFNNTYNILYLSSFLFRTNKEISSKIYCKLINCYIDIEKTDKNLSIITYQMIYMMYKRIDKYKLLNKLRKIRKLEEPELFIDPKIVNVKDFNEILMKFLMDFYSYCETNKIYNSFYDIFIPFLSFYYYYDTNNKLQIMVQELLCNRKNMYIRGGKRSRDYDDDDDNQPNNDNEINEDIFTDKNIEDVLKEFDEIEEKIQKIKNELLPPESSTLFKEKTKLFTFTETAVKDYQFKPNDYSLENDEINRKIIEIEEKSSDSIETKDYGTLVKLRSAIESKKMAIKNKWISNPDNESESEKKLKMSGDYEITPSEKFLNFFQSIQNSADFEYQSLNRIKNINNESSILELIESCKLETDDILSGFYDEIMKFYDMLTRNEQQIKELIKEKKDNDKRKNVPQNRRRDSNDENTQNGGCIYKGGAKPNFLQQIEKLKDTLNSVKEDLKRYKGNKTASSNTERKLVSKDVIDNDDYNIFDNLLKSYDDDIKKGIPSQITDDLFYNKVRANSLDPAEELKITFNDKLVFIGVAYVLRLIATYLTYYMINTNRATTLTNALFYYITWYLIIFVIIVFIINFDTFYLRVFINYLNMHINTIGITTHAFLMLIFIYIVYLLIININGVERPRNRLNDTEKVKLKYKFDLLTMIVFVFICLLTFVI